MKTTEKILVAFVLLFFVVGIASLFLPAPLGIAQPVLAQQAGPVDPCLSPSVLKSNVAINISSATTTQLIALQPNTVIAVCGFLLSATGATTATTAQFEYGTGSSCGTGTTVLTGTMGATTAASPAVIVFSPSGNAQFKIPAANALCLVSAGGTPSIQGYLTYVQQ